MVIQTWAFGTNTLKMNKVSLPLQGKQLTEFVANDKIQAFRQKLEFWMLACSTVSLTACQHKKTF